MGAIFALSAGKACAEQAAGAPGSQAAVDPAPGEAKIAAIAERLKRRADQAQAGAAVQGVPGQQTGTVPPVPLDPKERLPLGGDGTTGTPERTGIGLAASSEQQRIGDGGGGGESSGWLLTTTTALGVVIGLALLIRWGYAKLGGKVIGGFGWSGGSSPVVEVLSRSAIAPKNHVLLLRVGGRVLVVSDSSAGTRTLCEVTEPTEVADLLQAVESAKPESSAGGFGRLLNKVSAGYDAEPEEVGADQQEHRLDRARDTVAGLSARLRFLNGSRGGAA